MSPLIRGLSSPAAHETRICGSANSSARSRSAWLCRPAISARSRVSSRTARSRVRISKIAATTEKPTNASAVVNTANSWWLRSSQAEIVSAKARSAAEAGSAGSSSMATNPLRPWRASEVHDSRFRRIAATTPDMICPRTHELRPGAFPRRARIVKENNPKGTRWVRVRTVNANLVGIKCENFWKSLRSCAPIRGLTPGRAKAAAAAVGGGKRGRDNELRLHHRRNHHLRDALAAANRKRRLAVIDQDDRNLAAVIRVDRARRVQHRDAMPGGKARAWPHLGLIAGWQRDGQPGRHDSVFSGRQDQRRFRRHGRQQIEAGGVSTLIGRQRQAFAMRQLTDVDLHRADHEFFSTVLAIRATSSAATCSLVMTGQESTLMLSAAISAPSRVSR